MSLGYSLGSSYNHVLKAFSYVGYVAGALFLVTVVILFFHRLRVVRRERTSLHEKLSLLPQPLAPRGKER